MRIAIVGGGIAGLAAAWAARGRGEVTVFEPGRLGGKLQTEDFLGHPVDTGPDAFVARVGDALDLARELGLEGELVAPAADKALLWAGGRLRPLPDGLVLGVPGRLGPIIRSGILSPAGLARAGLDLVLPRRRWAGDGTVADVVRGRFGRQVADRLVDPLLGGIHAGSIDDLSADATAPQLADAARSSRSLLLGLRRAATVTRGAPLFLAPRGGMQVLADRLVGSLKDEGVSFEPVAVTGLLPEANGRVVLDPAAEPFDGAVLAVPASVAASLLEPTCLDAAVGLRAMRTASVVLTTLAYPAPALAVPADASGFLVPRGEGRLMTACSFGSRKWPHWSDPNTVILRVSAGRAGDERPSRLGDEALVERLGQEVAEALGTAASPTAARVNRWPGSFPQYEVGHLQRVARIETALRRALPAVVLAGASYRGSGIPACIASGRQATALVFAPER